MANNSPNLLTNRHIEKLGHHIEEIRLRALHLIETKYRLNLVDGNNTDVNKQLFDKLLHLFTFEKPPPTKNVLDLMLIVANLQVFPEIVSHLEADNILKRVADIEQKTDVIYQPKLSEVKDLVLQGNRKNISYVSEIIVKKNIEPVEELRNGVQNVIPANRTDMSQRTDGQINEKIDVADVIEMSETLYNKQILSSKSETNFVDMHPCNDVDVPSEKLLNSVKFCDKTIKTEPLKFLPWQPLRKAETKILIKNYENLRYIDDTATIVKACLFIKDVVLRDFPCEIFLQRPLLLRALLELLKTNNLAIRVPVLRVIQELLGNLLTRLRSLTDMSLNGSRWKSSIVREADKNAEDEDMKMYQVPIDEFCQSTLVQTLQLLTENITQEEVNLLISIVKRIKDISFVAKVNPRETCNIFENCLKYWENKNKFVFFTVLHTATSQLHSACDLSLTLQTMIIKCVADPVLALYYPQFHNLIISLVKSLLDQEGDVSVNDFKAAFRICKSMEYSNYSISSSLHNVLSNFQQLLPTLEFTKNTKLIKEFMGLCVQEGFEENTLRVAILLALLAYEDVEVRKTVYKELFNTVSKFVGPAITASNGGDKLTFLYDEEVFKEILSYGALSTDSEIQHFVHETVILLLRSKPFSSESTWQLFLSTLRSCLSVLTSFASTQNHLGRCVLRLFDPKVAESFGLSKSQVLNGNLQLLFSRDILVNEEAFSILCMMLTQQDPMDTMLPKIRHIKGIHLSSVCVSVKPKPDISVPNFSSARILNEALISLRSGGSGEKCAALKSLESALGDPNLQREFLESDGMVLMQSMLNSALTENDSSTAPFLVTSIIKILKIIAWNNSKIRLQLTSCESVMINILRSLLLFTVDDQFRTHGVHLLFILLFNDVIRDDFYGGRKLSILEAVSKNVHMPITVAVHGKWSCHSVPSLREQLMTNPNTARLIRSYWTILWMGDISTLAALTEDDLTADNFSPGLPRDMLLNNHDLTLLKDNWIRGVLREKLHIGEMAANHRDVIIALDDIISILTWMENLQQLPTSTFILNITSEDVETLPWSTTFARFLYMIPCCAQDEALLERIVLFLRQLLRSVPSSDVLDWLTGLLTNTSGVFVQLLKTMDQAYSLSGRTLRYCIIELAEDLIVRQSAASDSSPWLTLMQLVLTYLESNCAIHLDCFLSLLACITGEWRWEYSEHKVLYGSLVRHTVEVITSFKSVDNPEDSFMGSNIINNALLVLGHLLTDGCASIKGWEHIWQQALMSAAGVDQLEDADYSWLMYLVHYRDPVTRAAALTLIADLFVSTRAFEMLVDKLELGMGRVWHAGLAITLDDNECALVKEKAAILLLRLTALGSRTDCTEFLNYLVTCKVYEKVADICRTFRTQFSTQDDADGSSKLEQSTPTPSLLAALANWLLSVILLEPAIVTLQLAESTVTRAMSSLLSCGHLDDEDWCKMHWSIIRYLRLCASGDPCCLGAILTSPQEVRSLWNMLARPGTTTANSSTLSEVMLLLATLLQTPGGPPVVTSSLATCSVTVILETICNACRNSANRNAAFILINNLAAVEDNGHLFRTKILESTFAKTLCEIMLSGSLALPEYCQVLCSLVAVSPEAQQLALKMKVIDKALSKLRIIDDKLKVLNINELRKNSIRKKVEPMLQGIEQIYMLLTNLCVNNNAGELTLIVSALPRVVHKLWPWYITARCNLLSTTLKLLCTYSYQSERASQSLALTCSQPGYPKTSLIHTIIDLAVSEMDSTKITDTAILELSLQLLSNSCLAVECRVALAKGTWLPCLDKLLPHTAKTKRASHEVCQMWFKFLEVFTCYPEGQIVICSDDTAMEMLLHHAELSHQSNRRLCLKIITHLTFHPRNKCRILANPAPILSLILTTLTECSSDVQLPTDNQVEVRLIGGMLWSLAAGSQKAKMLLKNAGCRDAIVQARKSCPEGDCRRVLDQVLLVIRNN